MSDEAADTSNDMSLDEKQTSIEQASDKSHDAGLDDEQTLIERAADTSHGAGPSGEPTTTERIPEEHTPDELDGPQGNRSGIWRWLGPWRGPIAALGATLGVIFAAGSFVIDFRSQGDEADATRLSLSPIAEYVYWLGPPGPQLAGPNAASNLPEEFRSFRVVQTPGDWATGDPTDLLDGVGVDCTTSSCREITGAADRTEAAHRVVWLVLINAGSTPMQSISIEWAASETDSVETSDPFSAIRNNGITEGEPEGLVDLSPGAGLIIPLASVLRVPSLGTVSALPLGEVRVPVALRFTMLGESEEQRVAVRDPADVIVTGGYELDDGEVFEGGG